MSDILLLAGLAGLVALAVGLATGFYLRKLTVARRREETEAQGRKLIENSLTEAERIKKEAVLQGRDEVLQLKQQAENEVRERKKEVADAEERLTRKLQQLEHKLDLLDQRETALLRKEQGVVQGEEKLKWRHREIDQLVDQQRVQLEKISGISRDEAKQTLIASIESEARMEAAKAVIRIENEMKLQADRQAKNIIALAISRYAGNYVAEKTVSVVPLPNDEMKGRIIGREGRNIRAIEAATGIDVIIDDTPEAVILSGFNPVRREVARLALERLIADGRIHPARIEEVVDKAAEDLATGMRESGEQATFDVGAHGVSPELIELLGRLKYRTSYSQNCLHHSLEVAFLCGIMAAELGLNVKQAKRAGLLHDIGKAVDHEVEGPHAIIGADLAKKYGESPEVVHAIGAHHEDLAHASVLDILVQSADALSGARPGARREMLESYVKRLKDLEEIATSFQGVEKSYAIQAGREIRVIVDSFKLNDVEAAVIAKDIVKKIERELTYPGQIRVTVIRESRTVEYAK